MNTRTKGSTWNSVDNLNRISLLDYSRLVVGSDWSAAMTAALVDVASSGFPLYIPAGTYIVAPITLANGTTILGDGTLQLKAGSTAPLITLANNCILRGISLDGNRLNVANGNWNTITGIGVTNCIIDSVSIANVLTSGISISGVSSKNIRILNCTISGFTTNGVLVSSGNNIQISNCQITSPAVGAIPGNGIALMSDGAAITDIGIANCYIQGSLGEGIAITGFGTRNVTDVTIDAVHITGSTLSGFRGTLAERVLLSKCVSKSNGTDGFRLRDDIQFCRLISCSAVGNTGTGLEEVNQTAIPNNNTFAFCVAAGNGNNSIIKLGAQSVII